MGVGTGRIIWTKAVAQARGRRYAANCRIRLGDTHDSLRLASSSSSKCLRVQIVTFSCRALLDTHQKRQACFDRKLADGNVAHPCELIKERHDLLFEDKVIVFDF